MCADECDRGTGRRAARGVGRHAALTSHGHWIAAVLACGPDAMLSHRSAAAAWDLCPPGAARIDVTLPGHRGIRQVAGIRKHQAAGLRPGECERLGPLRLTSVARTLLDLAPSSTPRRLEQLINQADLRGRYDGRRVAAVLATHPHHRGAGRLRAVVERLQGVGVPRTRSEMEVRFLAFCDAHGLPQPAVNARIGSVEVDFRWPDAKLVVETDGWAYHRMPRQRDADADKRLRLEAAGHRVVVLTWRQIVRRPGPTPQALTRLLNPGAAR